LQSLPSTVKGVTSRADALSRTGDLGTAITRRSYRTGGRWLAGYRPSGAGTVTPEALAQAFDSPVYLLCLGRRSCPPSWPLSPRVVEADSAGPAFMAYARLFGDLAWTHPADLAAEDRADAGLSNRIRRVTRMDDPRDRPAWHFGPRGEWLTSLRPLPPASGGPAP
jgi:CRISPR system Cascade subunit CasD